MNSSELLQKLFNERKTLKHQFRGYCHVWVVYLRCDTYDIDT